MKKCFVHIGIDKTGTSSLQAALAKSTASLAAHGFAYPQAGQQFYHHYEFAKALGFSFGPAYAKADADRVLTSVRNEAAASDLDLIFSTEHFSYLSNYQPISSLKEFLKDYDVKIIVYLRNQIAWLPALYCEVIKWGYVDTFENYAKRDFYRLDFNDFVGRWATVFGRENIKVITYEAGTDTVSSFFKYVMGTDAPLPIHTRRENNSPTPFILEALRRSNINDPKQAGRQVFEVLQRATGGIYGQNDRYVWKMPQAVIDALPALQASNDELARTYLSEGAPLFSKTLAENLERYEQRCDTSAAIEAAIESAQLLITALVNQRGWLPAREVA